MNHSSHENADRKQPAKIAVEGDVAESQRSHHGQCPVESGEPGMFLPLAHHEEVEENGEKSHPRQERKHEPNQRLQIAAACAVLKNGSDDRDQTFHFRYGATMRGVSQMTMRESGRKLGSEIVS